MNIVINSKVETVLVKAKELNKWVLVSHLVPYGLHSGLVGLMETRNQVLTMKTPEGTAIKLTLLGYKQLTKEAN